MEWVREWGREWERGREETPPGPAQGDGAAGRSEFPAPNLQPSDFAALWGCDSTADIPASLALHPSAMTTRPRELDGSLALVIKVSSHESATFRRGGDHFCGRVAQLATRHSLLDFPSQTSDFATLWGCNKFELTTSERSDGAHPHGRLVFKACRRVYHSTLG